MNNQVEFGLFLRMYDDYSSILKFAQTAEPLGYPIAYVNDHFLNLNDEKKDFLEAWTLMTAIGVLTNFRISHTVICNNYRNPAMLAKMASTLDVITNGRFELGIGAGWHIREYQAYGYEFPKPSVRIHQMKEALQIIKKLWTESETTFHGKHYSLDKCINEPKPIQKPHPPIMVGGSKNMLIKVATEFADEINLPTSLERVEERVNFIYKHCDKIGRDHNELRFSLFPRLIYASDQNELDLLIKNSQPKNKSRKEYMDTSIVGTHDMVLERIQQFIDLGISRFALIMNSPTPERLQMFSENVINEFK